MTRLKRLVYFGTNAWIQGCVLMWVSAGSGVQGSAAPLASASSGDDIYSRGMAASALFHASLEVRQMQMGSSPSVAGWHVARSKTGRIISGPAQE